MWYLSRSAIHGLTDFIAYYFMFFQAQILYRNRN